jgi:hypothetical protein
MATGRENGDAYMVANAAMMRLEQHEKTCGERYRQIVANQNISTQDREKLREMISLRFKDLYGFLWKITATIVLGLVGAIVSLLIFIARHAVVWKPDF